MQCASAHSLTSLFDMRGFSFTSHIVFILCSLHSIVYTYMLVVWCDVMWCSVHSIHLWYFAISISVAKTAHIKHTHTRTHEQQSNRII